MKIRTDQKTVEIGEKYKNSARITLRYDCSLNRGISYWLETLKMFLIIRSDSATLALELSERLLGREGGRNFQKEEKTK